MTIVFNTATTANGYLADADHSLAWLFKVPGEVPDMAPFTESVTALVMGSHTYEWLLREERLLDDPQKWQGFYGHRPTYVFTTRDLEVVPGADLHFVRGPVTEALPAIRSAAGDGVIWLIGGGDLVGQFLDADALDEIVLAIAPTFLAGGQPLLPRDLHADRLSLHGVERVGQFALVTYLVGRHD